MILTELFNKTLSWDWLSQDDKLWVAGFMTENEGMYQVVFDQYANQKWTVEFVKVDEHQGDTSTDITGTGEQYAVFATVLDVIQDFVSIQNPYVLDFSAMDPSRIKLYNRMVHTLKLPGYKINIVKNKYDTVYSLERV